MAWEGGYRREGNTGRMLSLGGKPLGKLLRDFKIVGIELGLSGFGLVGWF